MSYHLETPKKEREKEKKIKMLPDLNSSVSPYLGHVGKFVLLLYRKGGKKVQAIEFLKSLDACFVMHLFHVPGPGPGPGP
jgi:hypothetical protein